MSALKRAEEPSFEQLLIRWRDDPVYYAKTALGFDCQPHQREILESLLTDDFISVKSGNGVGKTSALSVAMHWWGENRPGGKVVCTAPSAHQLHNGLWPEFRRWNVEYARRFPALAGMIDIVKGHARFTRTGTVAFTQTAREERPESMQGTHSPNTLYLVDEASGVSDQFFEAIEGSLTDHNAKILLAGNPTRVTGYFFDTHNRDAKNWRRFTVSGLTSPRVRQEQIERFKERYGEESDVYRIRVLGEFPKGDSEAILTMADCQSAMDNYEIFPESDAPVFWGLDPAFFGDRPALAKRKGSVLLEPVKIFPNYKNETDRLTSALVREYQSSNDKPSTIFVDAVGNGGEAAYSMEKAGLPVSRINVGKEARDKSRYVNLRAELYDRMTLWVRSGTTRLPDDLDLVNELTSIRRIETVDKMKIEKKSDMKARISRGFSSPDLADAFSLTFANGSDLVGAGLRRFTGFRAKRISRRDFFV